MSESFDIDNKVTLKSFFVFGSVLFFYKDQRNERKMETTTRQTQCPVSKILQGRILQSWV